MASIKGTPGAVNRLFSYTHHNGLIAVIVQMSCDSDAGAGTDEFKKLGHDLCLHIAGSPPSQDELNDEQPRDIRNDGFVKVPSMLVAEVIAQCAEALKENVQLYDYTAIYL